jgi:predicted Fe-Mo cluster-binding NifX family protein
MKIAVPTRGNVVDDHFGHCEAFTILTIDSTRKIINEEILPSTQGCGCKSNIVGDLKNIGVEVMLAGNMGGGALNILTANGIKVYRGCSGNVRSVAESYLQGRITDSGEGCNHTHHHGEGHQCHK